VALGRDAGARCGTLGHRPARRRGAAHTGDRVDPRSLAYSGVYSDWSIAALTLKAPLGGADHRGCTGFARTAGQRTVLATEDRAFHQGMLK